MTFDITSFAALVVAVAFIGLLVVLKRRFHVGFGIRTLVATALGVVLGLAFGQAFTYYEIIGVVYANAISAIVVPLLAFSIVSSITNLSDMVRLRTIGLKSVGFLILNTITASILTLAIAQPLQVGRGFSLVGVTYDAHEVPSITDTIVGLFPSNLAEAWANNTVVPIIIFAVIVALAYNRLHAKKSDAAGALRPFKSFVDATNEVLGETVSWIVGFTAYAVVALIGRAVGRASISQLIPLFGVMLVAYIVLALQFFGVESVLIAGVAHLSPRKFFQGVAPAAITAFTTQSSIGTIPVTTRVLTENLGVDEDVAGFTAGLGANLGMPGCAGMWPTLVALFAMHALGVQVGVGQMIMIVALAAMISIGTVGVPGTATITATAMLAALGLPLETIAVVAPISSLVDMGRTATNVVGAAEAAVVVAQTEGLIDETIYNSEAYSATPKKVDA